MNKEFVLSVENLSYSYDNGQGIKNMNFVVNKEFIGIVGSNGAGKTTLMNLLAGTIIPELGEIHFRKGYSYSDLGISTQKQSIDWYLSVFDNVLMGALLGGENYKEAKILTEKALAIVDLLNYKDRAVDELSGGQQQRVQIARALVHEPDFLMLDEPTTGLDTASSVNLLKYLRKMNKEQGKTILISSHDLNLIEDFCDKIIYINKGEIEYFGDLSSFVSKHQRNKKVKIVYEGEISQYLLDQISRISVNIESTLPLEVILPSGAPINDILKILTDGSVMILEVYQPEANLREIFIERDEHK